MTADTLRDELAGELAHADGIGIPWEKATYDYRKAADAVLPVVLRYADAQVAEAVAAEREHIAAEVTGLTFDQRCGQLFDAVLCVIARGQP